RSCLFVDIAQNRIPPEGVFFSCQWVFDNGDGICRADVYTPLASHTLAVVGHNPVGKGQGAKTAFLYTPPAFYAMWVDDHFKFRRQTLFHAFSPRNCPITGTPAS